MWCKTSLWGSWEEGVMSEEKLLVGAGLANCILEAVD